MMAVVFCAQCGSNKLDVIGWSGAACIIRCSSCELETRTSGLTIGRPYPDEHDPAAKAIPRLVELAQLDAPFPLDSPALVTLPKAQKTVGSETPERQREAAAVIQRAATMLAESSRLLAEAGAILEADGLPLAAAAAGGEK